MSVVTGIRNLLCRKKLEQEKINAGQTVQKPASISTRAFGIPVALGFAFMLLALANIIPPAQAVDINLSIITDTINAFIDLIEPITNLVIAIVPLWFVIAILGFVMGLLAAVLAMIKKGMNWG